MSPEPFRILQRAFAGRLRAHCLSLGQAGKRTVPTLAVVADENDAAFFNPMVSDERALPRSLLHRLM